MAYVYKHTRLDTNEIFYIGIGTDKYKFRPKDKKRRNIYWKNITNLTDWTYEVIFEHDDLEIVKQKEIELIKFYGRTIDGGTLCNMTLGGEGTIGLIPKNIKKCYGKDCFGTIQEFKTVTEAAKILGNIKNTGNISKACRKVSICKGYIFSYNKEDLVNIEYISNIWCKSPCGEIILFDNGNKASKSLNIRFGAIYDVLNGKKNNVNGWIFSKYPFK